MRDRIFAFGCLGIFASLLVGAGEFFLHYSPLVLIEKNPFDFFLHVPEQNLKIGHILAVSGIPFYFIGYLHVYLMLKSGSRLWSSTVLFLGLTAFAVGGIWIGSRGFIGSLVHLKSAISPDVYHQVITQYLFFLESLVNVLRVVIILLSVCFSIAVLKGGTHYQKWAALFNPFLILLFLLGTLLLPELGKYIVPILMNVTHFIFFSVSLMNYRIFKKKFHV